MTKQDPYGFHQNGGAYLEAEVAPRSQDKFQNRYAEATGQAVSPGTPAEYQSQPDKWGAECRIYFNDLSVLVALVQAGIHVEVGRPYRDQYLYRVNNNDLWWELVELYGFRLGVN